MDDVTACTEARLSCNSSASSPTNSKTISNEYEWDTHVPPSPCQQLSIGAPRSDEVTDRTFSVPRSQTFTCDSTLRECNSPTASICNSARNEFDVVGDVISHATGTISLHRYPRGHTAHGRVQPVSDQDPMHLTSSTNSVGAHLLMDDFPGFLDDLSEHASWDIGSETETERRLASSNGTYSFASCQPGRQGMTLGISKPVSGLDGTDVRKLVNYRFEQG